MTEHRQKLLIVEDDLDLQKQLRWSYDGFDVSCASSREEALAVLREVEPDTKIIVVSGDGAHESALRAISAGAWDFHHKPVDMDELHLLVRRAFHVRELEVQNASLQQPDSDGALLLGTIRTASPEMVKVARTIERIAPADISVLLLGASGTGKELLARGLHNASGRRDKPFVAINCGAIPENLLESELFGHEKGAFTGAVKTTEGKIELAHGGTLFLDEVGDIPLALQVKLLRFLQERNIERIGGRKAIHVDVRVVCATHRNLSKMISEQTFRDDLYYRLAEVTVNIPPLAARTGDAILLAKHFVNKFAREMNPTIKGMSTGALAAIDAWNWPGNVRELENRVKRAVIMAEGMFVTADDLDLGDGNADDLQLNLKAAREAADRNAITRAVARTEGNISSAAKLLGISRPTLYDLMKQYDLHV
ncbi:MAG: PEP-CTERM-box response regulator transcription factor [Sphingomonadales bacterium 35-56-22]|jgi:two-component system NtrC family response regulator|uniref:PEP-CTERM-box response regulator transcription factor n=1 Tax=Sphingorhabdus sp. TaxID=1902408 RepID=UPI000BC63FF7|nr:PEP-CTERM-box response regulator transcription factor [Sphingorhabdus sp.]OYY16434.1 MAG: PEP-CTERM-box response regulator transcription factor [Sphingomonadales bacterium 35-56-22]OYY98200.1 MAG: PEP-CTERM-box response regulator transcription factor [Sphingomonadales bacterium 28-56-43]OYZ60672.1 MAG: PEP-CTERM-box response regulator transcription factor [Sphingomonadales bacterium 24-56-14]OZA83780.1 MAG: PEP-CTERM-box response regulator transcription factor [Sphingomonadales bacterium 39-